MESLKTTVESIKSEEHPRSNHKFILYHGSTWYYFIAKQGPLFSEQDSKINSSESHTRDLELVLLLFAFEDHICQQDVHKLRRAYLIGFQ